LDKQLLREQQLRVRGKNFHHLPQRPLLQRQLLPRQMFLESLRLLQPLQQFVQHVFRQQSKAWSIADSVIPTLILSMESTVSSAVPRVTMFRCFQHRSIVVTVTSVGMNRHTLTAPIVPRLVNAAASSLRTIRCIVAIVRSSFQLGNDLCIIVQSVVSSFLAITSIAAIAKSFLIQRHMDIVASAKSSTSRLSHIVVLAKFLGTRLLATIVVVPHTVYGAMMHKCLLLVSHIAVSATKLSTQQRIHIVTSATRFGQH
jgi:hypothetical protein